MRLEMRQSLVLSMSTGTTAVLSLIYAVVVGRALGAGEYGEFTAAVSLATMCYMALGPINETVARFAAVYTQRGAPGQIVTLHREVLRRVATYGLIGGAVGLLLLPVLMRLLHFDSPAALVITILLVYLNLLLCVPRGILRGTQRFDRYSVNVIAESASRLLAGLLLLALFRNTTAALGGYLVGLVIVLVLSRVQLRGVAYGPAAESLDGSAIRRFTAPMFALTFSAAGFQNLDMLFVQHFFTSTEAGAYGAAFTLVRTVGVLFTPFSVLMLPILTSLHVQGRSVAPAFLRLCSYFLLLAAIPVTATALWPDLIVERVYGADYSAAAPVLGLLAAARLVGFLGYLAALAGVSVDRPGILYAYLPGLMLQIVALSLGHASLTAVVWGVLGSQVLTLVATTGYLLVDRMRLARRTGRQPGTVGRTIG